VLRYFRISPDRPVIIAASTLKGEEEPVLEAFGRIRATMTNALLIIAPRKPQRFEEAERLAQRAGWNVARRSELRVDAEPRHDVVILDTIGELAQLYQVATAVFVGGSLVDAGGHNILEPAVFGKPIVFGPYMHNFTEIAQTFLENAAAIQVRNGRELEPALLELLGDPVRRARLGAAARALVEANRGARTRTLAAIAQLLPPNDPANVVRPFRRV
jgi:3-deoxy-D-manno-octulosonic-acid transferase